MDIQLQDFLSSVPGLFRLLVSAGKVCLHSPLSVLSVVAQGVFLNVHDVVFGKASVDKFKDPCLVI